MRYLVIMETVETAVPYAPEELASHLDRVMSNAEALMKLEVEKKILAGGILTGKKGEAFIVEAVSNAELSGILMSLPLFTIQKVEVTPLKSFAERQAGQNDAKNPVLLLC